MGNENQEWKILSPFFQTFDFMPYPNYGSFEKARLYYMKSHLLFCFFYFVTFAAFCQDVSRNIPTHQLRAPVYHSYAVRFPAHIDSTLFSDYLNWALQKDSLPQQYKGGKPFSVTVYYVVSKEGKISEVRLLRNKEEQEDLFELIRAKLLVFPYQWSPAYQNGRPVKAFLKLRIVGNEDLENK